MPAPGEVWLSVGTGMLYEMRDWVEASTRGDRAQHSAYRHAHRIGAPDTRYGCESSVSVAVFDQDVREGKWLRVMNGPPALCHRCGLTEGWHTGDGSGGESWRQRHCRNFVANDKGNAQ